MQQRVDRSRLESCSLGFKSGIPLAISSGLLGILYGAACASLGVSAISAVLASAVIFSGAVQFAVLGLLEEPLAWGAIAISSLLVCNRFILMGASLADHLREKSLPARILSMQVLTDGAWAATIGEKRMVDRFWYFVSAGLCILLFWVTGTLLGVLGAGALDDHLVGALRFTGILFLSLLLLLVVRNTQFSHLPWIVSVVSSLLASLFLPLAIAFIMGLCAGGLVAWQQHPGSIHDDG